MVIVLSFSFCIFLNSLIYYICVVQEVCEHWGVLPGPVNFPPKALRMSHVLRIQPQRKIFKWQMFTRVLLLMLQPNVSLWTLRPPRSLLIPNVLGFLDKNLADFLHHVVSTRLISHTALLELLRSTFACQNQINLHATSLFHMFQLTAAWHVATSVKKIITLSKVISFYRYCFCLYNVGLIWDVMQGNLGPFYTREVECSKREPSHLW
jgi:hypothetical protein